MRADIEGQLRRAGYTVGGAAASGEDAIEKAGKLHPALILMDIRLAGRIDGVAAALRIRETSTVPIIFISAFPLQNGQLRGLEPPWFWIDKPFSRVGLLNAVRATIGSRAEDAAAANPLQGSSSGPSRPRD